MPPRKQSDYLADILESETAEEKTAPGPIIVARARTSTLLSRETALARVHSGEVRQVTQLLLDPERVRVWPGNARLYAHLSEENCRDLIDSILAEGGQKVPAFVRRVVDDPDHEYEVIVGTRRHWAISWLRRNSYPNVQFLAQAAVLDDEAAFRLADLENRARRDISDVERARNYAVALDLHYGGKQKRMAERLRVSEGWLSKMLHVATIPDPVLSAFASLTDVQLKPAYALARALDDHSAAENILAVAQGLSCEQAAARENGLPALAPPEIMRRLLSAAEPKGDQPISEPFTYMSKKGHIALTVLASNRQGITIRLHAGAGADNEELIVGLRETLARLDSSGRGVRR